MFCVVNLARHLDFDAETAMRGATKKFEGRFRLMEEQAIAAEVVSRMKVSVRWRHAGRQQNAIARKLNDLRHDDGLCSVSG